MVEVIDTAAWTGRDWDNRLVVSCGLFKESTGLLWLKRPRSWPQGTMSLTWGFQFGYDFCMDAWSLRFFWNRRHWTPLSLTAEKVFEFRAVRGGMPA